MRPWTALVMLLALGACGTEETAGTQATEDGGRDSGSADASGALDGGGDDAGRSDAGTSDAGNGGSDAGTEQCSQLLEPCSSTLPVAEGWRCHIGFCRLACDTGEHSDCPRGQVCTGSPGICMVGCPGFFSQSCPMGTRCAPVGNGAHLCIANGAGNEGQPCTLPDSCGADLLCAGASCVRPDCSADPALPCPEGRLCEQLGPADDLWSEGICRFDCDPFSQDCGEGERCRPTHRLEDEGPPPSSRIVGVCESWTPGVAGEFEPCASDDECSVASMWCDRGFCRRLCDARLSAGAGWCGETSACLSVGELAWGSCDGCLPWRSPSETVCAPTGFCAPDWEAPERGTCVEAVEGGAEGEACSSASPCASPLICDVDSGRCRALCEVEAPPGDPASCAESLSCAALPNPLGGDFAVGFCKPACGYVPGWEGPLTHRAAAPACSDPSAVCLAPTDEGEAPRCVVPAHAWPLAEGALCATAGYDEYDYCSPSSICLELGDGNRCRDLCFAANGALGSTNHLDCRSSSATCANLFSEPHLGLCREE